MLTLGEMVERVPALYDALRERDSLANLVCEVMAKGGQPRKPLEDWKKCSKRIKSLVAKALEAENDSRKD